MLNHIDQKFTLFNQYHNLISSYQKILKDNFANKKIGELGYKVMEKSSKHVSKLINHKTLNTKNIATEIETCQKQLHQGHYVFGPYHFPTWKIEKLNPREEFLKEEMFKIIKAIAYVSKLENDFTSAQVIKENILKELEQKNFFDHEQILFVQSQLSPLIENTQSEINKQINQSLWRGVLTTLEDNLIDLNASISKNIPPSIFKTVDEIEIIINEIESSIANIKNNKKMILNKTEQLLQNQVLLNQRNILNLHNEIESYILQINNYKTKFLERIKSLRKEANFALFEKQMVSIFDSLDKQFYSIKSNINHLEQQSITFNNDILNSLQNIINKSYIKIADNIKKLRKYHIKPAEKLSANMQFLNTKTALTNNTKTFSETRQKVKNEFPINIPDELKISKLNMAVLDLLDNAKIFFDDKILEWEKENEAITKKDANTENYINNILKYIDILKHQLAKSVVQNEQETFNYIAHKFEDLRVVYEKLKLNICTTDLSYFQTQIIAKLTANKTLEPVLQNNSWNKTISINTKINTLLRDFNKQINDINKQKIEIDKIINSINLILNVIIPIEYPTKLASPYLAKKHKQYQNEFINYKGLLTSLTNGLDILSIKELQQNSDKLKTLEKSLLTFKYTLSTYRKQFENPNKSTLSTFLHSFSFFSSSSFKTAKQFYNNVTHPLGFLINKG